MYEYDARKQTSRVTTIDKSVEHKKTTTFLFNQTFFLLFIKETVLLLNAIEKFK